MSELNQKTDLQRVSHARACFVSMAAFTRIELMVVLAVVATLLLILIGGHNSSREKVLQISCVNNLKQIGIAYRIWSNDNGDQYPFAVSQTNGGWRELVNSPRAGEFAWTNYLIMGDEVGHSPMVVVCPADERKAADDYAAIRNTNLSYFIGPDASDKYPQGVLGGDRNLSSGPTPQDDYGFSPADGKGNDVVINGPVCWSLKMHSTGKSSGSGNIMLGDGSAQQAASDNWNWLRPVGVAYLDLTGGPVSSNGIRLIFP